MIYYARQLFDELNQHFVAYASGKSIIMIFKVELCILSMCKYFSLKNTYKKYMLIGYCKVEIDIYVCAI